MKKMKLILLSISCTGVLLLLYALDFSSWQKLDLDKIVNANAASVLYDKEGNELGAVGKSESASFLKNDEIPAHVKNAFIACEDKRFYTHSGIDIKRIFGALLKNVKSASYSEGGSTITQQLVKLTHLSQEKKLSRKANEAVLAIRLEKKMTKDDILTAYLNTVYFGAGAYGLENASRIYFGKSARELTLSEAAVLAGIIKAPSAYSPKTNPEKAEERRNYVLTRMMEDRYISEDEMESAKSTALEIINSGSEDEFLWYRDLVLEEAEEKLGLSADEILTGGFQIYTCLDAERQRRIEAIYDNESLFPQNASNGTRAESAFICVNAQTGGILCCVGGREYEVKRGFNRATDARRQPGSALKPLSVYAAAVDGLGMSPTTIVDDTQRTFDGGYTPKNAGGSYNGLVTIREALSRSLNVASVSLIEFTGIDRAREYISRFGLPLQKTDNGLALALGSMTSGVTPLELTQGYAALSNGGTVVTGHTIEKIVDRNGKTVYMFAPSNKRAVTTESAYMLTSMLRTAAATGSARALRDAPCPVAAKTGTVSIDENKNRDAWTAAYTTEIAACVWMGFDETTKDMYMRSSESGSFAAKMMAEFIKNETGEEFQKPDTIVERNIDRQALENEKRVWLAPDNAPESLTQKEIFLKGREPSVLSPAFQTPVRPDAPEVFEKGDEIILRFTIKDESYEYLLFSETEGEKDLITSVSGTQGEKKEVRVPRKSETTVYTLAARNRIMHEAGVTLVSLESEGVEVYGKKTITDIFENLLSGF